jgi:hypothetical protein
MDFLYKKLRPARWGGVDVVGFAVVPSGVMAGQTLPNFIDNFPDEDAAREAHPDVDGFVNPFADPAPTFDHLPGEDDPVPGGMYPDDIQP